MKESDEYKDDAEPYYDWQEVILNGKFKLCDFKCQKQVTLAKYKTTKYIAIFKLGTRTFCCFISICKNKKNWKPKCQNLKEKSAAASSIYITKKFETALPCFNQKYTK